MRERRSPADYRDGGLYGAEIRRALIEFVGGIGVVVATLLVVYGLHLGPEYVLPNPPPFVVPPAPAPPPEDVPFGQGTRYVRLEQGSIISEYTTSATDLRNVLAGSTLVLDVTILDGPFVPLLVWEERHRVFSVEYSARLNAIVGSRAAVAVPPIVTIARQGSLWLRAGNVSIVNDGYRAFYRGERLIFFTTAVRDETGASKAQNQPFSIVAGPDGVFSIVDGVLNAFGKLPFARTFNGVAADRLREAVADAQWPDRLP